MLLLLLFFSLHRIVHLVVCLFVKNKPFCLVCCILIIYRLFILIVTLHTQRTQEITANKEFKMCFIDMILMIRVVKLLYADLISHCIAQWSANFATQRIYEASQWFAFSEIKCQTSVSIKSIAMCTRTFTHRHKHTHASKWKLKTNKQTNETIWKPCFNRMHPVGRWRIYWFIQLYRHIQPLNHLSSTYHHISSITASTHTQTHMHTPISIKCITN